MTKRAKEPKWYIVMGRANGDDEATSLAYRATSRNEAVKKFCIKLEPNWYGKDNPYGAPEDDKANDRREADDAVVYIDEVWCTGQQKPRCV